MLRHRQLCLALLCLGLSSFVALVILQLNLGKPDKDFAEWWSRACFSYGLRSAGGDCPHFARWTVQEAAGKRRHWYPLHGVTEVHFTGKLLDGTVFASSREYGTLMFTPAEDDVMIGFSLAIRSMKPGEKAVFIVAADLARTWDWRPTSIPWNIPPDQTLCFDIELISITIDIRDNGGVLKKIIKFGEGKEHEHPGDLDDVFVNYNARLKDGTSVSKSEGVAFSLADGFFCPALAHAVKTMEKGEEAVIIIKPEYGFGEQGRPSIGNEAAVPPDATLYVNLQLMSWISVSYVGANRDIIKKIITTSPHSYDYFKQPYNQAVVKVRLIGKLQDGTVFDRRGHDEEKPLEFTIDEEHVIYGLDEAVMTMHEGEVASFTIPPQHAFGVAGSNQYQLAVVPPNSVVIYEMELLSIVDAELKHPRLQNMTSEESIEAAKIKERDGDDLFSSGKYLRAYRRYLRARQILPPCFKEHYNNNNNNNITFCPKQVGVGFEEHSYGQIQELPDCHQFKEMLISITLKSAECAILLQRYEQASKRYHEVLEYDPGNAKALEMVAQPLPKSPVEIDSYAMTRGLEDSRAVLRPVVKRSGFLMMQKYDREPGRTTIFVPRLAANASQPPVSTPAAAAGPQPQRPVASATPAVGSSSSSSVTPLEASVEAKLSTLREQLPQWRDQPFTVFRVPAYVRESNPTAYKPRMVSIGPYYHGDDALRAMEDHKWRYLHDLLSRSPAVSSSLLIQEMRSMKSRALACYSERPAMDDDEFVRMLLLDGSFILEFFFKWHYRMTDPLCDASWGRTLITSDLLLLENQIPFFVVEKLYDVVAGAHGGNRETLFNLFLEYIGIRQGATPSATSEIHHLLHLLYESVVPTRSAGSSEVRVIPRAAEMSAAGVTFVARSSDRGMHDYDVTFDASRGVMEIPVVEVDDMNRPLLINLIAFEQSQGGEEARVVMSYVNLMSMLVRTAEDVALLRRCSILVNLLADDEAAAQFFSHLGDGSAMNYKRQVFSVLYHEVDRYCGSWWHRNMAALRRDYFDSPWSAISFVVAALFLALTATQTYFTVFPSSSK